MDKLENQKKLKKQLSDRTFVVNTGMMNGGILTLPREKCSPLDLPIVVSMRFF